MFEIYSNPDGMEPTAVTLHTYFADAVADIQDFGDWFPDLNLAIAQPLPTIQQRSKTMNQQSAHELAYDIDEIVNVQAVEDPDEPGETTHQVTFSDGFATTDYQSAVSHANQ